MAERLQKIISAAGLTSRRKAEEWIRQGRVVVNGQVVRELGSRADWSRDSILVDGEPITRGRSESYLVYKPQGVLCSVSDPKGRRLVTQLVPAGGRLYPAGRLDYQSEGLVILTSDGALARAVTAAGRLAKVYRVKVRGVPTPAAIERLRAGIRLEGRRLSRSRIRLLKKAPNCWFEVVLRQGRNRQIRRMFEQIGHPVMRLRRVAIGPLGLARLRPGEWRRLTRREIDLLKGVGPPGRPN